MNENIRAIVEKIAYFDETFPKEELRILLDNREESAPYLLDSIRNAEEVLDKLLTEDYYFLPFYALYILAQFREPAAYPLVYQLFSAEPEDADAAFDDFITEDLGRVLASVSGGDTSLINRLIEDENVYDFVRSAALGSWFCLFRAGLKTRDEIIAYYKTLFELPAGEEDFLRGSLVWHCLDLKAVELMPEIEKSYAENKVEIMLMGDWGEFQKLMAEETSRFLNGSNTQYDLVDDMIADIETWHCFKNPKEYMQEQSEISEPAANVSAGQNLSWESDHFGTFERKTAKVGKNEPCPCGSGRKYKKCCMN